MRVISAHKYHNRYEFLADIERILENCILYNGKDSTYTQKAEKMVQVCRITLDEVSVFFLKLAIKNLLLFVLSFFHYTMSSIACIPIA
jgi:transcription initiation factor TFIID subunit 1